MVAERLFQSSGGPRLLLSTFILHNDFVQVLDVTLVQEQTHQCYEKTRFLCCRALSQPFHAQSRICSEATIPSQIGYIVLPK